MTEEVCFAVISFPILLTYSCQQSGIVFLLLVPRTDKREFIPTEVN
jgi:hypothetical protein